MLLLIMYLAVLGVTPRHHLPLGRATELSSTVSISSLTTTSFASGTLTPQLLSDALMARPETTWTLLPESAVQ